MSRTTLREMTEHRRPKFGHYVGEFVTPGIGHILASARCDFVFFDMEHSGFSIETLKLAVRIFEAAGVSMIVRAPSKDYDVIARICDAGAEGVMTPMTHSAAEAAAVVAHLRYPPQGQRGIALGIAHDNFQASGVVRDRLDAANRRITYFALIESRDGAENADAIAATPGVDALWIGHFDLSASLGIAGQFDHPAYREAEGRIISAARAHGKPLGRLVVSPAEGLADIARGFDFCCYATDSGLYQRALIEGLTALRGVAK